MKKRGGNMVDRMGHAAENLRSIRDKANEFVEKDRKEKNAIRMEKELRLANMSVEERNIVESVDRGLANHELDFKFEFDKDEARIVKEICIYKICKEKHIKCAIAAYRMDHNRQDSVNIVSQIARELLDKIEVKGWNVNHIIHDLNIYEPNNKFQPAIEKIIQVPDPRAVNPLIKALKSNKHRKLILNALLAYVSSHEDYIWEINTDDDLLIQWSAKYALISLCLQPYSNNMSIIPFNRISELIETVPRFAKFILDIGILISSPDTHERIRGIKNIGRREDRLFDDVLHKIFQEDPHKSVRDAAKSLLKHFNSEASFNSMIENSWKDDNRTNRETESYNDVNYRDFEAQIEENEDYLDDILAGIYRNR
jgi:hypothetical protein